MNPPSSQGLTRTNVAKDERETVSSSSYSQNNIDDDIDELLRCFGPANSEEFAPNIDFSDVELDKNLSEILEDLQNVKTEGGENNNSLAGGCSSLPDDPFNSLWNVQRNIELEEQRLEKLRRPRFQTLPAYKKRAKQETQWLEAVHAAKIAVSPKTELEEYMGFDLSSDLPSVSDGGGGVEVISGVEDAEEVEDVTTSSKLVSPKVSACIDLTADLPLCKSNYLVNTERHLSSDNHFPANSRIFNRSLEELQCTANAISQTFLEKEKSKPKRAAPKPSNSPAVSPGANKRRKLDPSRSILVKNNNNSSSSSSRKAPTRLDTKKVDVYNSVWIPARQERLQAVPAPASNVYIKGLPPPPPPPPLIPVASPSVRVRAMNVYKRPLVPLARARAPVLPSPRAVKLPITGIQQNNKTCLLLNINSTNPILLNKTQILQKISSKSPVLPPPPGTLVGKSCYNCQKLNSYLPFLGYKFRKHQGTLRRNSAAESVVLLCEICGAFVRESVIYGEEMSLSHVSAAHYPKFFDNTSVESGSSGETQNYISI